MKRFAFLPALLLATPAAAQMPVPTPAQAPAEPDAIPLYPDMKAPKGSTENWVRFGNDLAVRNVTVPTLTPVLPDPAKATGAAVVVAPGGAFMLLAMDHEGWSVARWLADHGIAAFVLKYRLNQTPADTAQASAYMGKRMADSLRDPNAPPSISEPRATLDALAALKLVRANAGKWGIDAGRVGMIGFSAGAMTTLNAALEGKGGDRPSFIGYVYGPMLARDVPADAPPISAMSMVRCWPATCPPTRRRCSPPSPMTTACSPIPPMPWSKAGAGRMCRWNFMPMSGATMVSAWGSPAPRRWACFRNSCPGWRCAAF
jgi:acetyl esterase/lipase